MSDFIYSKYSTISRFQSGRNNRRVMTSHHTARQSNPSKTHIRNLFLFVIGLLVIVSFSLIISNLNLSWFHSLFKTRLFIGVEKISHLKERINSWNFWNTITRQSTYKWLSSNYKSYYQESSLSCEIAMLRMVLGFLGIESTEKELLEKIPRHKNDPNLGLVAETVNGNKYYPDGSINWNNYGAHAPVLAQTIQSILDENSLSPLYKIHIAQMQDSKLIEYFNNNPQVLGAIIWVAGYNNGKKPPVNERGQVLGEHVQLAVPIMKKAGEITYFDPWPTWKNQPLTIAKTKNRDLFGYSVLIIEKNMVIKEDYLSEDRYWIYSDDYREYTKAMELYTQLSDFGWQSIIYKYGTGTDETYKVFIGPYKDKTIIEQNLSNIKKIL